MKNKKQLKRMGGKTEGIKDDYDYSMGYTIRPNRNISVISVPLLYTL